MLSIRHDWAIPVILCAALAFPRTISAQDRGPDDSTRSSPLAQESASTAAIAKAFEDGRNQEVVVLADRALAPGSTLAPQDRPLVHLMRGSALRRLERPEEGLVAFDAAAALGYSSPRLTLERALALRALGRSDEAFQTYERAQKEAENDPDQLEEIRRRWREGSDAQNRLQFRLIPSLGYDSNILFVDKDTPLQKEYTRQSPYADITTDLRYLLYRDPERRSLLLEWQSANRYYSSESSLSYSDNVVSATWDSPFGRSEVFGYELRVAHDETFLASGGRFRTMTTLAAALIARPNETWQVRLWGDYSGLNFYGQNPPDPQDRDGVLYRGGIVATLALGQGWLLSPAVTYWLYSADGSDFDHHAWDFRLGVTTPEIAGFQFTVTPGVTFASYDNPNSLTGFTTARSDRRYSVQLAVTFRQLEKLLGFAPGLSVEYDDWRSNVDAYAFRRYDVAVKADIAVFNY